VPVKRLQNLIGRHGLWGLVKLIPRYLYTHIARLSPKAIAARRRDAEFDRHYGTDTSRQVSSSELDFDDAAYSDYQVTSHELGVELLASLDTPLDDYSFVDFGSGKGRMLLIASRYPFREVIGVELSELLHNIACKNIELYRDPDRRCKNIQSVPANATEYHVPANKSVYFFYNPFAAEPMQQVADNLARDNAENLAGSFLIYVYPEHRTVFDNSPAWEEYRSGEEFVIYRGY
jgi:hypothetical protein